MYYYILDPQNIPLDRFEKLQTELQGLLTEFNIAGETARVTPLRSIGDLVDTASQRGATTLIACGGDETFNVMLASLKGRDFILGYIPFLQNTFLSTVLGIDSVAAGARTIAARRIVKMDLAAVASNFFLSYLEFGILSQNIKQAGFFSGLKLLSSETAPLQMRIDNSYTVTINTLGGLLINSRAAAGSDKAVANPTDGSLDLLILERLSKTDMLRYRGDIAEGRLERVPKTTIIKCRRVDFLEPAGFNITMLGRLITKFPAAVEIIPQRLRMIVGKNRTF